MIPLFSFPGVTITLPPEVTIDFVAETATVSGDAAVITDLVSCTQAGTTYARSTAGELTSFAADTLRITDMGLLVEGERTNHCPESTTLGVVDGVNSWILTAATVTVDDAVAPDGTMTAIRVNDTATTNVHSVNRSNVLGSPSGQVCCSIYAKAGTLNVLCIRYGHFAVFFDLLNGKWRNFGSTSGTGAGIFYNAYIEEMDDGWYRCSTVVDTTATAGAGAIAPSFNLAPNDHCRTAADVLAVSANYAGDGTGTLYLWGPQVEEGAIPSSYIKTVGKATATRAADVVTLIGAADTVVNVDSTTAASVVAEVLLPDGAEDQKIICSASGSPNLLGQAGASHWRCVSNVSTAVTSGMSVVGGDFTTGMFAGVSWDSTGRTTVAAKGEATTGSHEAFIAEARTIGDGTLFGYVKSLKLWNTRLSAGSLRLSMDFAQPEEDVSDLSEDYYFGAAGDRVNMLTPTKLVWTAAGGGLWSFDGGAYTAVFTRNRITPCNLPGDWNIGTGPRFFQVNVDAATVSLGAATTAPDDSSDAVKIVEEATLSEHFLLAGIEGTQSMALMTDGVRYKFDAFLKKGERTRAVLVVSDLDYAGSTRGGVNGIKALFDLHGGQTVSTYAFGEWSSALVDTEITPWGDGWYRCRLKFRYPEMSSLGVFAFQHMKAGILIDAGHGTSAEKTFYTGDGSGLYMWKANCLVAAADEQITGQLFHDHFTDRGTIDVNDTRVPGFNWYPHRTWPTLHEAAPYNDITNPVLPDLLVVEDSHFSYTDRAVGGHDNDNKPGVFTAAWVGNSIDAYATGEGLAEAATSWADVKDLFVGTVFRPPILAEANMFYEHGTGSIDLGAGLWCKEVLSYLTPWLNPDGTPINLLWPTRLPEHVEMNMREEGSGMTIRVILTDQVTGTFTEPAKINLSEALMPDNTVAQTYGILCTIDSADDKAMGLFFAGDIFLSGCSNTTGTGREYLNDKFCTYILYTAMTGHVDWVTFHGDPAVSMDEGTATGPL